MESYTNDGMTAGTNIVWKDPSLSVLLVIPLEVKSDRKIDLFQTLERKLNDVSRSVLSGVSGVEH